MSISEDESSDDNLNGSTNDNDDDVAPKKSNYKLLNAYMISALFQYPFHSFIIFTHSFNIHSMKSLMWCIFFQGVKKKIKRFSRKTALEMLGEKYKTKADLKERELNVRMSELEFEKQKFSLELEERKQRHKVEMEERQLMVELLKKKM